MKGQTVKKRPTIYSFPTDKEECIRWIIALPNILPEDKDLSNIGVCERHWPPDFPTIRKKGSNRPAIPPSVFDVPKSFTPQTSKTMPRRLNKGKIDFESWQPQISPKIEIDPEVICNWDAFTKYCKSLPFIQ